METVFYIVINIKSGTDFESIAKFYVGNNRKFAHDLFRQLEGRSEVNDSSVLTLELMETINGLPLNLQIITCTLEELACNCKIITKELFKHANLENGGDH